MGEYLYCCKFNNGYDYVSQSRDSALSLYAMNNGIGVYRKTKDLYPEITIIIDKPNVDIRNIRKGEDVLNMSSFSQRKANKKYDENNTIQVKLKLNLKNDKQIIDKLNSVENKQGYIKELIKKDLQIFGENYWLMYVCMAKIKMPRKVA